nr:MAG TPA: hypothetical protein [Caudoviricetes sp.]
MGVSGMYDAYSFAILIISRDDGVIKRSIHGFFVYA